MAITKVPLTPSSETDESWQPQHQETIAASAAPVHPPHGSLHHYSISNASTATLDIESWTVAALESLDITPIARGTGNSLSFSIDSHDDHPDAANAPVQMKLRNIAFDSGAGAGITPARRPPVRRNSVTRREQMLKGNEGSRHRRRWENDHLLNVPNVQPPQPSDWQIRPTHPVVTVHYELAKYWDKGLRERVEERKAAFATHRKTAPVSVGARAEAGRVPRDLRVTAKKTPAVKSWLRVLEEPVRQFLVDKGLVAKPTSEEEEAHETSSSEDDEIVFVGRNGAMLDGRAFKKAVRQSRDGEAKRPAETGMVLDSLGDDETGAFKRWLTHSISDYYGLDSKSVTLGSPARRVVYVGVKQLGSQRHAPAIRSVLPPPLWEMF